jgi:hypothetical protein
MTYDHLKTKLQENKQTVIYVISSILIFVLGYGTGRANQVTQKIVSTQPYSSRNITEKQSTTATTAEPLATDTKKAPAGECTKIKGNISAKGDRIYHMPGGASYKRVNPEQCFATESEATAAGFRKASR